MSLRSCLAQRCGVAAILLLVATGIARADLKTWDGKHSIDKIEVQAVYFVPRDRTPLPDWKERVDYFCSRIEAFHRREYQGQSTLATKVHREPFQSARNTEQLRAGDGDFTFFRTLEEVASALDFGAAAHEAFPILLVFSDVNWRPLDDFYRLKSVADGFAFEGTYSDGQHFPGAVSGGARATYLADRGVGWGLVSADGWRVPYRGSDCVVYHEGVGHTVGLPHPEPGNGSVMSLGQYRGWINESWIDDDQKKRLGWHSPDAPLSQTDILFSKFKALPEPLVPKPGENVSLKLTWPEKAVLRSCRVRLQTDLFGPWVELAAVPSETPPENLVLGRFDRATPVSYRVDATLNDNQHVELWGYFQVREAPDKPPLPGSRFTQITRPLPADESDRPEIDLLVLVDSERDGVLGKWALDTGRLVAPHAHGARIELPYQPPEEYRLTVIAEPLDEPNGLILGQRMGGRRFQVLLNFASQNGMPASALEEIDGLTVDRNATAVRRALFKKNRLSEIICTVRNDSVVVHVDGTKLIDWHGKPRQLSLSDYWKTPRDEALFVGAYDCRYRIHRVTLRPLSGEGRVLEADNGKERK